MWPVPVAPFKAVIVVAAARDEAAAAGQRLYQELGDQGVEALLDDRDARAGVKFADAELIGVPWRVTVGRALADGVVELTDRATGKTERVSVDTAAAHLATAVTAART